MKTFSQLSDAERDLAINYAVNDILISLDYGEQYTDLVNFQRQIDDVCDDANLSHEEIQREFYRWFEDNVDGFGSVITKIAEARAWHAYYQENDEEVFWLEDVLTFTREKQ